MASDAQTRPSLRQASLDLSRWRLKLIGWPLDSKRLPVLLILVTYARIISATAQARWIRGLALGAQLSTIRTERSGRDGAFCKPPTPYFGLGLSHHPARDSRNLRGYWKSTSCHRLFSWRSLCAGLPIPAQSRAEDNLTHHGGNTGNHRERV